MKAKLGISVGLIGALMYFVAYFGGYIPALLIAAYVLIAEENEWLKKTCVKALMLLVTFSILFTVIGLLPDLLSWIASLVTLFEGKFDYSLVTNILRVITGALDIFRTCLFLILGLSAFGQKDVTIPLIDDIIARHF